MTRSAPRSFRRPADPSANRRDRGRPIVVLCPHFAPDNAPTGTVMTRIVDELADLGHEVHVVTALPWYRNHAIEDGWTGKWVRTEATPWGSITRLHPFPGDDKSNLMRRASGFVAYSLLAGIIGLRAGGWFRRAGVVIAMSPPLTLGLTGKVVAMLRRSPLVFNIQDHCIRTYRIYKRKWKAVRCSKTIICDNNPRNRLK